MDVTISILAIIILAGLFVFVRNRENKPKDRRRGAVDPRASSKFHAVSIKFLGGACEAVKKLEGKRFLSSAAPTLPLPDCDVDACKCRFIHHQDRRAGEDRRSGYRGKLPGGTDGVAVERRKRGDRRDDSPDEYFQ